MDPGQALRAFRGRAACFPRPGWALALALLLLPLPAHASATLVELFTSQGCSSCPKANAFLGALSEEKDVLALTYGVSYWDYLGWRDTFAKPAFTARQKAYAHAMEGKVYTPQIVVNGASHASGGDAKRVRADMAAAPALDAATIAFAEDAVTIAGPKRAGAADVWLAEYTPGLTFVAIKRGENKGRALPHYNVVTRLDRLGDWRGGAQRFAAPCASKCVVIVQEPKGGRVLAAALGK